MQPPWLAQNAAASVLTKCRCTHAALPPWLAQIAAASVLTKCRRTHAVQPLWLAQTDQFRCTPAVRPPWLAQNAAEAFFTLHPEERSYQASVVFRDFVSKATPAPVA